MQRKNREIPAYQVNSCRTPGLCMPPLGELTRVDYLGGLAQWAGVLGNTGLGYKPYYLGSLLTSKSCMRLTYLPSR